MTQRTTKAELDQLVRMINKRLGRPEYDWYRSPAGPNVCRVGALTLDRSYGGNRLHEVVNSGGGVREIGPRLSAGPMANYLHAILAGIDFAEANLGGYGQLPVWEGGR